MMRPENLRSFEEKRDALDAHFRGEASSVLNRMICTFGIGAAQRGDINYLDVNPNSVSESIHSELEKHFESGKPIYAVVLPIDIEPLEGAKIQFIRLFAELGLATDRLESPVEPIESVIMKWRCTFLDRVDSNADFDFVPFLGDQPRYFVNAMGPHVPLSHFRYAPHSVIVGVNQEVITAALQDRPSTVISMHQSMRSRTKKLGLLDIDDSDGVGIRLDNQFFAERLSFIGLRRLEGSHSVGIKKSGDTVIISPINKPKNTI